MTAACFLRSAVLSLACLAGVAATPIVAAETSPEATVREAYAIKIRHLNADNPSRMLTPFDSPHRQRLMTKDLSSLVARDELFMKESGDQGHLASDHFISGQDGEVKNLQVSVAERSAERATVFADFMSFAAVRVTFWMKLEGGRWRIDDIVNRIEGKDDTVRYWLSKPYECGSFIKKPCKR